MLVVVMISGRSPFKRLLDRWWVHLGQLESSCLEAGFAEEMSRDTVDIWTAASQSESHVLKRSCGEGAIVDVISRAVDVEVFEGCQMHLIKDEGSIVCLEQDWVDVTTDLLKALVDEV